MKTVQFGKNHFNFSFPLLMGITLCLVGNGCSKAKNFPSAASIANAGALCPPNVGGEPATCCNTSGLIMPPPQGCPTQVVGNGGIVGSLVGGATAAGTTVNSAGSATALASNQGASSPFAKLSAATAGGTITTPTITTSGATSSGLAANALRANSASGMGGGGAGGGGAGGGGLSDMSTAPAGDGSGSGDNTASNQGTDPNVAGATYSGSAGATAGGAAGRGQNGGFGSLFGGAGGAGGAGNAASELGFGNRSPASDAMGTLDPEDYFSRIDLHENIFKRVETRYRNKQMTWASTAALQLAPTRYPTAPGKASLPR